MRAAISFFCVVAVAAFCNVAAFSQDILLTNVNLIDGTGKAAMPGRNILIRGERIFSVSDSKDTGYKNAMVKDMKGKTIMPSLMSAHSHIGNVKGKTVSAENYTRENILSQLKRYASFGVSAILSMGSDRPLIFNGLRDSSVAGLLPGARLYSAGYGFGVENGGPPVNFGMDGVVRPDSAGSVASQMNQLAALKPSVIKIWVDDFGGKFPKMKPEVYKAIIREAHKHRIRVAAHVYYVEDARQLVKAGIDIIAHSIRDREIDDALLERMKARNVIYIPTLSLDEYAFIYAQKPEWIDDPFFKASLEPGVYEMITSDEYQETIKNSPALSRDTRGFEIALLNLKKIFRAGILVAMGTDSGANPVRAQGFSEHLELELMTRAGLTPLEVIAAATQNSAKALRIDKDYGALTPGKFADFIVLNASPEKNIRNTRSIEKVWIHGSALEENK